MAEITQSMIDDFRDADRRRIASSEYKHAPGSVRNLKQLNSKHHEILRLKALGLKTTEVSELTGMGKQQVSNVLNSPIGQQQLSLIQGGRTEKTLDILDKIQEILPTALDVMKNTLNGGTLENTFNMRKLQVETAQTLMEMGGCGPIKRTDNRNVSTHLTGEDMKGLIADIKQNHGFVDDATEVIDVSQ